MTFRNLKISLWILLAIAIVILGVYKIMKYPYRMAVSTTIYDYNDSEFPVGTKYFDASYWLKQRERYIKVDDYYMIDLQFTPITNFSFALSYKLHRSIKTSSLGNRELKTLANMSDEPGDFTFYDTVKDHISWEYLYTGFEQHTLQPIYDFFLVKLTYQGKVYTANVERKPYDSDNMPYSYFIYGIYAEGEPQQFSKRLMYEEYLKQQDK